MPQAAPRIVYVGGWGAEPQLGYDATVRAHLAALTAELPDALPILLGPDPSVLEERFAIAAAPGLSGYLLGPGPAGGPPDRGLILRRLAVLVAAAEGRGLRPDAPRVPATIQLLAEADAVIVLAAGSLAGTDRDALWSQAAAAYISAARGVRVLVSAVTIGPIEEALDRVVLGRLLRSAARVAIRERNGSVAYARRLGAGEVAEGLDEAAQLAWVLR